MTELISVRINDEILKELKVIANNKGRTLSGLINDYLKDSVYRQQNIDRKDGKNA